MSAERTIDTEGRLAIPGFVEPHIHLDKALILDSVRPNVSGTLTEAIEIIWERKRNYKVEEIAQRAGCVITSAIENGVTHLRTHVDVDSIGGLRPLEGYPDDYANAVMDKVAAARMNMIVNPATNLMLQGRLDRQPKRRGSDPFSAAAPLGRQKRARGRRDLVDPDYFLPANAVGSRVKYTQTSRQAIGKLIHPLRAHGPRTSRSRRCLLRFSREKKRVLP